MASRFAIVNENEIKDLLFSSENENTRKSTNYWMNVFKKWAAARKVKKNS